MVEAEQRNSEEECSQLAKMPAAILSLIAHYLPNAGKVRMSRGSLFFNQAMQQHFKLLILQEENETRNSFERVGKPMSSSPLERDSQGDEAG